MKKYFTIFRQVEEEIDENSFVEVDKQDLVDGKLQKIGRWVLPVSFFLSGNSLLLDNIKNNIIKNGGFKVKLFLCSTDIEVGDKNIYTPRGIGECILRKPSPRFKTHELIVVRFGPELEDTEAYALNEVETYKIIGQVSPNATWVKEYDEFDEEDVLATLPDFDHPLQGVMPIFKIRNGSDFH